MISTTATAKLASALSLGRRFYLTDPVPWDSDTTYVRGNIVTTADGVWVCHATSVGDTPGDDDTHWWLLVGPASTGGVGTGGGTTVVDMIALAIGEGTIDVVQLDGETVERNLDTFSAGLTFLVADAVPAFIAETDGEGGFIHREGDVDGLYTSLGAEIENARGVTYNVVGGVAYPVDMTVDSAPSFSHRFTVPEEDYYDESTGFKVTHNQPYTGMLTVVLYDLGVIGDPDKLTCRVYNNNTGARHTDWDVFAPWGRGLFCGTAAVGDDLTITVYGPWSTD